MENLLQWKSHSYIPDSSGVFLSIFFIINDGL